MKISLLILYLLFCYLPFGKTQTSQKVAYFQLQDVSLLQSPFLQAQKTDLHYILSLDPDRLLAPYLREAGLSPKAPSYTNWENTGLDGHIGGHYLSALSLMYASTKDSAIYQRLDYMLKELHRAQKHVGTGFLGGTPGSKQLWEEIEAGNIRAGHFDLNGKWVPLYNIHKTYAGLRDAYFHVHSQLAKNMLIAMCDWMLQITSHLNDAQIQNMLRSEHGGLNEIFADVAYITGKDKYLTLARRFSHMDILNPLLRQEDQLTGLHANTQIPKVIGYKRIADLVSDKDWDQAARFFWKTVVGQRTVCIGGNSVREHFHPTDNFESMLNDVQGPETCNTYNMLRLTKMLYQSSPDVSLVDYYERALYNHILSSQQPEKGGFVYFTPMRAGHYRVYSQPETSMWCCVGSGLENHAKYGEFIYAHTEDTLIVNLFIPSQLQWKEKGVRLTLNTRFPDEGKVKLTIDQCKEKHFSIRLRCPYWASGASVAINGKTVSTPCVGGKYITVNRKWKVGDEIILHLPMRVALEQIPDQQNYFAFLYGPIVLASPMGTEKMTGLYADDSRGGHIAHGEQIPLQNIPILSGTPADLLRHVQKNNNHSLSFCYSGDSYPTLQQPLQLVPFFRLHDTRYAIYFQQALPTEIAHIQEKEAHRERKAIQLANNTVDLIYPGEQQPESDHAIRYEDSETGIMLERHYRRAKGWFCYQLKKLEKGQTIAITVHQKDKGKMKIFLNQKELMTQQKARTDSCDNFVTFYYPVSQNIKGKASILKLIPDQTEWTPAVFEIRTLKSK